LARSERNRWRNWQADAIFASTAAREHGPVLAVRAARNRFAGMEKRNQTDLLVLTNARGLALAFSLTEIASGPPTMHENAPQSGPKNERPGHRAASPADENAPDLTVSLSRPRWRGNLSFRPILSRPGTDKWPFNQDLRRYILFPEAVD